MSLYTKIKEMVSKSARERKWTKESHPFDTFVRIDGVDVWVGKFTYGVGNIQLAHHRNSPPLRIGRFCSIAGDVKIFTGAYHRTDWMTTYPFGTQHQNFFGDEIPPGFPHSKGGVTIGNDVWIGTSATIMSGVTIGDGAVIAANSHVIKNVAPYEIVGGNPAGHIKFRFPQPIVEKLLRVKWWDLDNATIARIHKNLTMMASSENVDLLIHLVEHSTKSTVA
jgi:acetyltransferase-like isoleucine patch superfamily enzyme